MTKTLVADANQLKDLLTKKYNNLYIDFFDAKTGRILCKIENHPISIVFKGNSYLIICTNKESINYLYTIMPTILIYLNGEMPLCYYEVLHENQSSLIATYEWNFTMPQQRLSDLLNNQVYPKASQITSFRTFKEPVEKIYGIYPGIIKNVDKVALLNEIELFINIALLSEFLMNARKNASESNQEIDLTEEQYALEYLIYQTTKFGITLPSPQKGYHIIMTPSYSTWYNFYHKHFKCNFNPDKWKELASKMQNSQDIVTFSPKKDYQEEHSKVR